MWPAIVAPPRAHTLTHLATAPNAPTLGAGNQCVSNECQVYDKQCKASGMFCKHEGNGIDDRPCCSGSCPNIRLFDICA